MQNNAGQGYGKQACKNAHPGRRGVAGTEKRSGKASSPAVFGPSLSDFLRCPLQPKYDGPLNSGTGCTIGNYNVLYDDAVSFCGRRGVAAPPPRCTEPEMGLSMLMRHLWDVTEGVDLMDDCGRYRIYQTKQATDGWESYLIPVGVTFTQMREPFGRLVRRFLATMFRSLGITETIHDDWGWYSEVVPDWYAEDPSDDTEAYEERMEFILDYFSPDPESIGGRLDSMFSGDLLTESELLGFRPEGSAETKLYDLMMRGRRYLRGDCGVDILSYAEYQGSNVIDDDADDVDCYMPINEYFGFIWADTDSDCVAEFIVQAANDRIGSGAYPQRLMVCRELADPLSTADELAGVREAIDYISRWIDALNAYVKD